MITNIVTHSGKFHADDVLGVSILLALYPQAKVERTRHVDSLQAAVADPNTATVDVGGSSDASGNNFDHHQREGGGIRTNCCPYAAAGLVWSRYGAAFVQQALPEISYAEAEIITGVVDQRIIQFVDAVDNGALETSPNILKKVATPAPIHGCSISTLVHLQNPVNASMWEYDTAFMDTVSCIGKMFHKAVGQIGHGVLQEANVRASVLEHVKKSPDPVLVLETYAECWQRVVLEEDSYEFIKYVIFHSPEGTWMCQQVPASVSATTGRKPLPEAWAGLNDGELVQLTGVKDAIFCHRGRFICGAASLEGAIALARLAVASRS